MSNWTGIEASYILVNFYLCMKKLAMFTFKPKHRIKWPTYLEKSAEKNEEMLARAINFCKGVLAEHKIYRETGDSLTT